MTQRSSRGWYSWGMGQKEVGGAGGAAPERPAGANLLTTTQDQSESFGLYSKCNGKLLEVAGRGTV